MNNICLIFCNLPKTYTDLQINLKSVEVFQVEVVLLVGEGIKLNDPFFDRFWVF